jgi:hypothetical protein
VVISAQTESRPELSEVTSNFKELLGPPIEETEHRFLGCGYSLLELHKRLTTYPAIYCTNHFW